MPAPTHPLFDASVPVFMRYPGQLKHLVDIAGRHCEAQAIDPQTVVQARITQAHIFLATLQPEDMRGSESRQFTDPAGMAVVTLDGGPFLLQYALPNFFFHIATAYAILRHTGVPLSKGDFDGWHAYSGVEVNPRTGKLASR
jgi:hypothetical protein